jgi:hypothetical protein
MCCTNSRVARARARRRRAMLTAAVLLLALASAIIAANAAPSFNPMVAP